MHILHLFTTVDCVECMACSDNVVRAGLTPKFKDKKTLCDMLTYKARPAEENLFKPVNHSSSPTVMVRISTYVYALHVRM